jgi:hypothetical protein
VTSSEHIVSGINELVGYAETNRKDLERLDELRPATARHPNEPEPG